MTQTGRIQAAETPTGSSGMPEETLSVMVTQMSDSLVTKVKTSSCPDMIQLLEQIKTTSAKPADPDSIISKVLNDVKTNPKLKAIIIQKLSEPLLNRMLECNMVPLEALSKS
ncbi:MAG: hypothetical protein HC852_16035 [Acaryochloridaceae cyanobacterium RU_4_10]|nr:hypothetical protein [Acaryochloridaceae cyanobacterium RU_4_10]